MVKYLLFLFLFIRVPLFAQQEKQVENFYKSIHIIYDWSIEISEEDKVKKEDVFGKEAFYRVLVDNNGLITEVDYFDKWGNPAHSLFDKYYNIYFSKAVASYGPGQGKPKKRISKFSFFNYQGVPVGYVRYRWDNKHIRGLDGNIRWSYLYSYSSSYPKGFSEIAARSFVFGNGGLDHNISTIVNYVGSKFPEYQRNWYSSTGPIKEERYKLDSSIFYTKEIAYSFGKIKSVIIYDDKGVKILQENIS